MGNTNCFSSVISIVIWLLKSQKRLKVNNNNFKFNGDFKNHITVKRTPEKQQTFPYIYIYIYIYPCVWINKTKQN